MRRYAKSCYKALSNGFAETLTDSTLSAEAEKMKLNIDYLSGGDAKKLLTQFADYPPAVLAKARSFSAPVMLRADFNIYSITGMEKTVGEGGSRNVFLRKCSRTSNKLG